jgi:hypothetical protein
LCVYALVNFSVTGILMGEGNPIEADGRYIRNNHGQRLREVSKEEYSQLRTYEVRLASGHVLPFLSIATVYLLAVRPRLQQSPAIELPAAVNSD